MLRGQGGPERLWRFDYHDLSNNFQELCREIGFEQLTLYMTRQSGPSIDRASGERMAQDAQKKGRWNASKSLARLDKAGN